MSLMHLKLINVGRKATMHGSAQTEPATVELGSFGADCAHIASRGPWIRIALPADHSDRSLIAH